jgi:hypothetical protein
MSRPEKRPERLRQASCGGCIAGILGALLSWIVLVLAGVTHFLFAACAAGGLGIGAIFAAWLHSRDLDRGPRDDEEAGMPDDRA